MEYTDKILGQKVSWNDKHLLPLALSHRSIGKNNNERLEFLGDSILSLVISACLYQTHTHLSEGELSRLRSQLVKGKTLAEVARYYYLGDHIILGAGEVKSGGTNKDSLLADTVEAIFGAIYLDQGYEKVEKYILQVMSPWIEAINPNKIEKDNKSQLQEILQKYAHPLPIYRTTNEIDLGNDIEFTIECEVTDLLLTSQASAMSRKLAEQRAAEKMINLLPFEA